MISNLLYKELRLAAHPNIYIFSAMGALVLIPAYPYTMIFVFSCIGIYISFMYGRETNDIYFSSLLPIKKSDIVLGKYLVVIVTQLASLFISIICAIIKNTLIPNNNPVGIDANIAFYGFGFIIFTIFNLIFLSSFFKTAYNAGIAFLKALVPIILIELLIEVSVHFPKLQWLDGTSQELLVKQLPILILGVTIYIIFTMWSFKISTKRFSEVDL
ncbi:ABC-2 transporter permease [Enterococcus gallinarum]|uniref:ABC-2 transporter permease n=1 Tax=Enterococcus gallinarum TaxID=1353 RepID=UPI0028FD8B38|nr:ABC-2 transporter permease [Enterococcus gallinarum]GMS52899.1 ABC-2 transporter permease [Enterococcus gallinarum]